jgi:hypothetical protein
MYAETRCAICGKDPGEVIYVVEDKVTHKKVDTCESCQKGLPTCYLCGLPASTNAPGIRQLEDGRTACARDAKTAVFDKDEVLRIFNEALERIERTYARFTSFPETNITAEMVDRINLQQLLTTPGNDYHCPNILGYTHTTTNQSQVEHRISLMSGLPMGSLQAVCAHELAHAWIAENVPSSREPALDRDAQEGFCELIAYLYADSLGDEREKALLLENAYTRGQVHLFIAATAQFGINDVLDWMRFGMDARLVESELARVRNVQPAPTTIKESPSLNIVGAEPQPVPEKLLLKAILWDAKRPTALINNCTLGCGEQAVVKVGTKTVTVRCLAIRTNSVRIQLDGSLEEELALKASR